MSLTPGSAPESAPASAPASAPPTALGSFLDYLRYEKRYSVHTITAYQQDLRDFSDYLELHYEIRYEPGQLNAITHSMIRSWLAELKENKISSRSINRKISSLKSFFKYHLKRGTITQVPTANIISPKSGKRLPVFMKEGETAELIASLQTATEDWKTLNAKMLVVLFYATGMRLTELITLKTAQVDADRSQIKVLGKGNKERVIPVSAEVLKDLLQYEELKKKEFGGVEMPAAGATQTAAAAKRTAAATRTAAGATETAAALPDTVLVTGKGRRLYSKYAYLLVKEWLGKAGTLEKKSPHVLRHTFATHLMNQGADLNAVKELLGHASLAATQVYTHNSIEKLKDVHKKAHPKG